MKDGPSIWSVLAQRLRAEGRPWMPVYVPERSRAMPILVPALVHLGAANDN